ncbi:hypothetical protein F4820DRAFT_466228 [Hypoxylon rubiginosum]|uniref:Uncharacterized protein n=1 Tax=Hypoxylon rubiginosum TaxID=110542 RepID=A0ACB9YKQ7_9PEZI|nr:hypothetical protein F4820DRAFT_466228 [Hypoxylon rubiginosum]
MEPSKQEEAGGINTTPSKQEEARGINTTQSKHQEARGEALPSYNEAYGPSSYTGAVELPAESPPPAELPAEVPADLPVAGPTKPSPFNIPSDADLPPYVASPAPSSSSSAEHRPIAIPQIHADPTAPFLDAYAPLLLRHGVTPETWSTFLRTLSELLSATVSRQAVSHATEIAQRVGDVPRRFGRETWQQAKRTGRAIGDSARRRDYAGAAAHVAAGTFALPLATAFRAIGASVALPFAALGAAAREPRTPRERAAAYAESASAEWLRRRGLEAHLLDTAELARALGSGSGSGSGGLSAGELLQTARGVKEYPSAAAQLAALGSRIVELELRTPGSLELEASTLWLVVTQRGEDYGRDHHYVSEKGKERWIA